ncbi:hypothetical protein [Mycobacterium sp. shizuoka-1]|uniref:hypothetical protein n=1 Tax=Mycobacterium sp. shizuoka-1 TaxID=2039281 RepID=UPI000C064028|nr:hypothetical protein [Mycobacterium sp. shizuoka-1]GAY13610.1 hypothetical protein MSZK_03360 [Mycobacterium sp. shizuoka-1]
MTPVERPSPTEVHKYLSKWRAGDNERLDAALRTLFQTMPHNTDVGEVAVKVAALNGLYGTGIWAVWDLAKHIATLDIDAKLAEPTINANLVAHIAHFEIKRKVRHNYSFATKYCSFHRPDLYPIYDSLVHKMLNTFLQQYEPFDTFVRGEHWRTDPATCAGISRNYAVWCRSTKHFRKHYGLEAFSIRDIDKYLWTLAKERQAMRHHA